MLVRLVLARSGGGEFAMTSPKEQGASPAREEHVTTKTGRILSISQAEAEAAAAQATMSGSPAVGTMDPARRTDVLFRVRRDEGHELSFVVDDRCLPGHLRSGDRAALRRAQHRLTTALGILGTVVVCPRTLRIGVRVG